VLLAIDIGNSAIKFGVFDGRSLIRKISTPTRREQQSAELHSIASDRLNYQITRAVACSVVPQVDEAVNEFVKVAFGVNARFIDSSFDLGLKIDYRPVDSLGTDRLVNAFAASTKYGKPCIVCSLGTATTIDAVDSEGKFIGGVIAPGMRSMAKALHIAAAKLPEVEIEKPASIVGRTTAASIQSGVFYGQVAMIEGIVQRISVEIGGKPTVVATGGFASMLVPESKAIDIVDENLLLEGLNLISRRLYT
jgi:type III pantothenate kinase